MKLKGLSICTKQMKIFEATLVLGMELPIEIKTDNFFYCYVLYCLCILAYISCKCWMKFDFR